MVGLADAIGGVVFVRWLLLNARRQLRGLLGYPIYWTGQLMVVYAALRAFDADVGLAPLVVAFTTGYVVTALPLPAGGAGGIEAALALTLNAVGVPLESALLAAVTYRIVAFWLPLIPTLVLLPTIRRLDEDLPRTPREERGAGDGGRVSPGRSRRSRAFLPFGGDAPAPAQLLDGRHGDVRRAQGLQGDDGHRHLAGGGLGGDPVVQFLVHGDLQGSRHSRVSCGGGAGAGLSGGRGGRSAGRGRGACRRGAPPGAGRARRRSSRSASGA